MKKYIVLIFALFAVVSLNSCSWFDDGVRTAHQEFDPSAMLKKYEWFKNQSERIQKMDMDISNTKNYKDKIKGQFEEDNGKDHTKWDPVTKSQYNDKLQLAEQMYMSTVAQRNSIVADYNAQSSKFNWEPFKSKTDLPPTTFESLK